MREGKAVQDEARRKGIGGIQGWISKANGGDHGVSGVRTLYT